MAPPRALLEHDISQRRPRESSRALRVARILGQAKAAEVAAPLSSVVEATLGQAGRLTRQVRLVRFAFP
jgi:hypothetical protein